MDYNKEKKTEKYEKEWLKEKAKEFSYDIILCQIKQRKLLEILNQYPHNNILEIGCGFTPIFPKIEEFDSYTIVEPSKVFCDIADGIVHEGKYNERVKVINGFFEDVYRDLGKFDFIFLSGVLHEVPNATELLNAAYELCNPNTIFHVNVTNVYSLHNLIGYEMGVLKDLFEQTETGIRYERNIRFDMKRLTEIVEEHSFEVIESGSYIIKPFTNSQMEKMLEHNIIDLKVLEGLEKIIKYLPDFGAEIYVNTKKIIK